MSHQAKLTSTEVEEIENVVWQGMTQAITHSINSGAADTTDFTEKQHAVIMQAITRLIQLARIEELLFAQKAERMFNSADFNLTIEKRLAELQAQRTEGRDDTDR